MFFIPSKYYLLDWQLSHYRGRLSEAKTVKEFNFLSETIHGLEQSLLISMQ